MPRRSQARTKRRRPLWSPACTAPQQQRVGNEVCRASNSIARKARTRPLWRARPHPGAALTVWRANPCSYARAHTPARARQGRAARRCRRSSWTARAPRSRCCSSSRATAAPASGPCSSRCPPAYQRSPRSSAYARLRWARHSSDDPCLTAQERGLLGHLYSSSN